MYTINDLLQLYSEEELEQYIKTLGIESPHEKWAALRSPRTKISDAFIKYEFRQTLYKKLPEETFEILRVVALAGGIIKESELLKAKPKIKKTLQVLSDHLILIENRAIKKWPYRILCIPEEIEEDLPLASKEDISLGQLLRRQDASYHLRMTAQLKLDRASGSKGSHLIQARNHLLHEPSLKITVEELSDTEKEILKIALDYKGLLPAKEAEKLGLKEAKDYYAYRPQLSSHFLSLYEKALLFPLPWPSIYPEYFVVPTDLVHLLMKTKEETFETPVSSTSPEIIDSYGIRIGHDLRLFEAFKNSGRLKYNTNQSPDKKNIKDFIRGIGLSNVEYGVFLYNIQNLLLSSKKEPTSWLKNPTEYLSELLGLWIQARWYQETIFIKETTTRIFDTSLFLKRQQIVNRLKSFPVDQWVDYDSVTKLILPDWLVSRILTHLKASNPQNYSYYNQLPKENQTATLYNMLTEPLLWLGLIEVGYRQNNGAEKILSHIRITTWGHFLLNKQKNESSYPDLMPMSVTKHFLLQPNCDIIAPPDLDLDVLTCLFKIAMIISPTVFQLTKDTLREALAQKWTYEKILGFLTDHSKIKVSPAVIQFLEDVTGKHGDIYLGRGSSIMVVKDPALLKELQSHKELRNILKKTIQNNVVVFSYFDLAKVERIIKKLGHIPVVENEDQV